MYTNEVLALNTWLNIDIETGNHRRGTCNGYALNQRISRKLRT